MGQALQHLLLRVMRWEDRKLFQAELPRDRETRKICNINLTAPDEALLVWGFVCVRAPTPGGHVGLFCP